MSENVLRGIQRNLTDFSMLCPSWHVFFYFFQIADLASAQKMVYAERQIHAKFVGPTRSRDSLDIVAGEHMEVDSVMQYYRKFQRLYFCKKKR